VEETPLDANAQPVLLQHGLLSDGVVFGVDYANCFVVRRIDEPPENRMSDTHPSKVFQFNSIQFDVK
jgi:hypothetical protein